MTIASLAILFGLALTIWSADRFIDGAAGIARHYHLPPLLVGMLIIGFGTSAPEMMVAGLSAWQGNPGLALGNAFGSNICNIALVLGLASLIRPITVQAQVLRRELPILALVTAIVGLLLWGGYLSRGESGLLLLLFSGLMFQSIRKATSDQHISTEENADFPLGKAWLWTLCGILVLFAGSRLLVWGSITLAQALGINDVVIGLTIVALGTSLPELAATVTAAWKGRHELALGNVLGSNLFNTLAVVGITGIIQPTTVPSAFLSRDILITGLLTASLFLVGYGFRGEGRINRLEGAGLLAIYPVYNFLLLMS